MKRPLSHREARLPSLLLLAALLSSIAHAQSTDRERTVLGERSALEAVAETEAPLQLPAGTRVRARPDSEAPLVGQIPVATEATELGREGDWVRIRWHTLRGWVYRGSEQNHDEAWLRFEDPAEPTAESIAEQQAVRRQRAARVFGAPRELEFTRYVVLTDLSADDGRWAAAEGLLRCYQLMFHERWTPLATSARLDRDHEFKDLVLLFSNRDDYQAYTAEEEQLEGVESGGHAFPGTAALHLESGLPEDSLALMAHELAHLETAKHFGPSLPAWLEEGLAEDMAWSVAQSGSCDTPGGFPEVRREARTVAPRSVEITVTWSSAILDVACARERWPKARPPLGELLQLDAPTLRRRADRTDLYVAAAFLVRWSRDEASLELRSGETLVSRLNDLSPQDLSPQGLSPRDLSPQDLSPQGLSPRGLDSIATWELFSDGSSLENPVSRWIARSLRRSGRLPKCPRPARDP